MIPHMIPNLIPQHDTVKHSIMKYPSLRFVFDRKHVATKKKRGLVQLEVLSEGKRKWIGTGVKLYGKSSVSCPLKPSDSAPLC